MITKYRINITIPSWLKKEIDEVNKNLPESLRMNLSAICTLSIHEEFVRLKTLAEGLAEEMGK